VRGVIGPVGLLLVIVVVVVGWALFWRGVAALGPIRDDELRALGVPEDAQVGLLVGRWRDRARRWRTLGGMPIATLAIGLGVASRAELRVGIGGAPMWSDPVIMGLLGAFAGAIGAELHHVWRRPSGPRTVSLERRELPAYLPARGRLRLAVAAVVAAVSVALHLVVPASEGVPVPGLLAAGVVALVLFVHRAVVARPRPALPGHLFAADDVVRGLAIRSVEAAGSGAVVLLSLWQLSTVTEALLGETGVGAILTGLLYLAGFVVAMLWWREGNPARLLMAGHAGRAGEVAAP
jgi:hypothetical protein